MLKLTCSFFIIKISFYAKAFLPYKKGVEKGKKNSQTCGNILLTKISVLLYCLNKKSVSKKQPNLNSRENIPILFCQVNFFFDEKMFIQRVLVELFIYHFEIVFSVERLSISAKVEESVITKTWKNCCFYRIALSCFKRVFALMYRVD